MIVIFLGVACIAVIYFFITKICDAECECKHSHFARYESRKTKTCVDCGKEFPLNEPFLPNHQR